MTDSEITINKPLLFKKKDYTDMKSHITTNIKVDTDDYEAFRILTVKRDKRRGEAIGDLISAEVKKYRKLIEEESK